MADEQARVFRHREYASRVIGWQAHRTRLAASRATERQVMEARREALSVRLLHSWRQVQAAKLRRIFGRIQRLQPARERASSAVGSAAFPPIPEVEVESGVVDGEAAQAAQAAAGGAGGDAARRSEPGLASAVEELHALGFGREACRAALRTACGGGAASMHAGVSENEMLVALTRLLDASHRTATPPPAAPAEAEERAAEAAGERRTQPSCGGALLAPARYPTVTDAQHLRIEYQGAVLAAARSAHALVRRSLVAASDPLLLRRISCDGAEPPCALHDVSAEDAPAGRAATAQARDTGAATPSAIDGGGGAAGGGGEASAPPPDVAEGASLFGLAWAALLSHTPALLRCGR